MKNRAKCKLCSSTIESFHRENHDECSYREDYVECTCGEIAIWGGPDNYNLSYNDINNFLRIDDEGNEIVVKEGEIVDKEGESVVKEGESDKSDVKPLDNDTKPTRKELIEMLDTMAKNIEDLPSYAKQTPCNQYDMLALISLLSLILKTKK